MSSYPGFADSHDFNVLAEVLHAYCAKHDIGPGKVREWAASTLMSLFAAGITIPCELSAALEGAPPCGAPG